MHDLNAEKIEETFKTAPTPEPVWTFRGYGLRPSEFTTAMVHLYRGEIQRSNTWRMRLDNTTNWAVIAAGAAIWRSEDYGSQPVAISGRLLPKRAWLTASGKAPRPTRAMRHPLDAGQQFPFVHSGPRRGAKPEYDLGLDPQLDEGPASQKPSHSAKSRTVVSYT